MTTAILGLTACEHPARPLVDGRARGPEARLTSVTLYEETDGEPTLTLRAARADVEPHTRNVHLVAPVVRFAAPAEGVRAAELRARTADLDATGQSLHLRDDVELRDAAGRSVRSASAIYALGPRRLELRGPASASAASGSARAARVFVDFAAQSLELVGDVEAELVP